LHLPAGFFLRGFYIQMKKPNLLFDLDGTLTDSQPGIVACIRHALKVMDFAHPESDDLRWCLGPPLHKSFARILGTENSATITRALHVYRERFTLNGMFENEVYPGIRATLEALSTEGHTMCVATSKPRIYAEKILKHFELDQLFKSIHGSELDGTHSDKPALIAHVLRSEDLDAEQTYMFGDREHDVIGARANKVVAVGVLWGYGSREELTAAQANFIIERPEDILNLL
jgi:phosphoglycolate phosphatase